MQEFDKMSKEQESMEESRTGNGIVSHGDSIKIVFDDGGRASTLRGTIINIDSLFITLLMKDGNEFTIAKRNIIKIVKKVRT